MIELYYAPGACSFVPHVALEMIRAATGASFEPRLIKLHRGEHRTPEYLALNPEGQVPTLVVDGGVLTQIVAISDFLDRSQPAVGVLPTDPWARAQALSTLAFFNNTAHPTFTHFFMPNKFADGEAFQAEVKRAGFERYHAILKQIDQRVAKQTGPYWLGERLSVLDAYALTLLRWGSLASIDPESLPSLNAYVQRVAQAAPVAAAIERERLQLNMFKKG
jgi:glutathione S-transferase